MMKIMFADICEAFKRKAVGSKVKRSKREAFMKELRNAIRDHDWSKDKVQGQAVLSLPFATDMVSPGTWFRNNGAKPEDFVIREYRGEVGLYLKRRKGWKSENVRCVVYTRTAYEKDPDFTVMDSVKVHEFFGESDGYVLVAVLGSPTDEPSTVSYSRFVKNLAGANNEYKVMTKDELVDLAKRVVEYHDNFIGVAD